MRLHRIVAPLLLLGAAGFILAIWADARGSGCPAPARLDHVLGGGAAVCLGAPFARLHRFGASTGRPDDSGPPTADLTQSGLTYTYSGHSPLAPFLDGVLLSVESACVEGLSDSLTAQGILTRAQAALGGRWVRTAPVGSHWLWESSNGAWISTDGYSFACLSPRGGAGGVA